MTGCKVGLIIAALLLLACAGGVGAAYAQEETETPTPTPTATLTPAPTVTPTLYPPGPGASPTPYRVFAPVITGGAIPLLYIVVILALIYGIYRLVIGLIPSS